MFSPVIVCPYTVSQRLEVTLSLGFFNSGAPPSIGIFFWHLHQCPTFLPMLVEFNYKPMRASNDIFLKSYVYWQRGCPKDSLYSICPKVSRFTINRRDYESANQEVNSCQSSLSRFKAKGFFGKFGFMHSLSDQCLFSLSFSLSFWSVQALIIVALYC